MEIAAHFRQVAARYAPLLAAILYCVAHMAQIDRKVFGVHSFIIDLEFRMCTLVKRVALVEIEIGVWESLYLYKSDIASHVHWDISRLCWFIGKVDDIDPTYFLDSKTILAFLSEAGLYHLRKLS